MCARTLLFLALGLLTTTAHPVHPDLPWLQLLHTVRVSDDPSFSPDLDLPQPSAPELDMSPSPELLPSPQFLPPSLLPLPSPDPTSTPSASVLPTPSASVLTIPSPTFSPTMSSTFAPTLSSSLSVIHISPSSDPSNFAESPVRSSPSPVLDSAGTDGLPPTLPSIPPEQIFDGPRTQCFPAAATVTLLDRRSVRMDALRVGDRLSTDPADQIFLFTHQLHTVRAKFLQFHTPNSGTLRTTGGHFVYVLRQGKELLLKARDVRVGDFMPRANGTAVAVVAIDESIEVGLFNPQTASGDIVVDGFRVTTYTEAVTPAIAHALLVPVRALYVAAAAVWCHISQSA